MNDQKQELRLAMHQKLEDLSADALRISDTSVMKQVLENAVYLMANHIFCYYSTGREISTHGIIRDAISRGKTVALPRSKPGGEMEFWQYDGVLRQGMFGIMEPLSETVLIPKKEDLIIVPGLCYDRRGYRLGRGGGYYDRYLMKHHCISIGVCRNAVLMDRLPVTWNDVPVDYVITETETI